MRLIVGVLAGLLILPSTAYAQQFCGVPPFKYVEGQPVSATMKVVVSTAARPSVIPGREPINFCNLAFRSDSPFYKPITVNSKPSRGEVAYGSYSIRYRSNKVGNDEFSFVLHHMNPLNNQILDTPVTVNVEVVPAPF